MKDNGGPAFPRLGVYPNDDKPIGMSAEGGMTIRDYFAVHAPAEEIDAMSPQDTKQCAEFLGIEAGTYKHNMWPIVLAKLRYQCADAMIEERAK